MRVQRCANLRSVSARPHCATVQPSRQSDDFGLISSLPSLNSASNLIPVGAQTNGGFSTGQQERPCQLMWPVANLSAWQRSAPKPTNGKGGRTNSRKSQTVVRFKLRKRNLEGPTL